MTSRDQDRWDQKHAAELSDGNPSAFLKLVLDPSGPWRIAPGRALDVAAGKGRNAVFLAEKGFEVEGIDVSAVALEEARKRATSQGLRITFNQSDLDHVQLPEATYDLIIDFNFLLRALIPGMKRALKVGGHIIFETYLVDQKVLGHPKNPAYLLRHNELLDLFRDFRILLYREGRFSEGSAVAYRAGLFGQRVR
jgi:2-polyprenyl-3-methyl-5-hydroxy-6-metoxy-1,4-benzoquinol methylase